MTTRPNPKTRTAPDATRRAAAFRRMREAQRTEVAEDYVELIGDLIAMIGEARLTDLAEHLGVSQGTAAKVVQRLQRDGLVESLPYRSIFLTEHGAEVAASSRERHRIVHDFLRASRSPTPMRRASSIMSAGRPWKRSFGIPTS